MTRFLGVFLAFVLLVHLQCGGSCLIQLLGAKAQTAAPAAEPPCHQHGQMPSKGGQPSHETNSPCSQDVLIQSKTLVKKIVLNVAVLSQPAIVSLRSDDFIIREFTHDNLSFVLHSPAPLSVLRT